MFLQTASKGEERDRGNVCLPRRSFRTAVGATCPRSYAFKIDVRVVLLQRMSMSPISITKRVVTFICLPRDWKRWDMSDYLVLYGAATLITVFVNWSTVGFHVTEWQWLWNVCPAIFKVQFVWRLLKMWAYNIRMKSNWKVIGCGAVKREAYCSRCTYKTWMQKATTKPEKIFM
jgi:hypothetical protein